MIASPSGPQLTPGGQMSGPIRSVGKSISFYSYFNLLSVRNCFFLKDYKYLKTI